jgi:hypothetical protein
VSGIVLAVARTRPHALLGATLGGVAAVLDVVTTRLALAGGAHELNPVVAGVMHAIGVSETLALGLVLRAGIIVALAALGQSRERPARAAAAVVLGVIAVWWFAVDTHNLVTLL